MNPLRKRLEALESRVSPNTIVLAMKNGSTRQVRKKAVLDVYSTLYQRTEERYSQHGSFPIPKEAISDIPMLDVLLNSVEVKKDLPENSSFPLAPMIDSIRLMTTYTPYQVLTDAGGKYMMKPGPRPIRIRFVRALNGRPHPDQLAED